MKRVRLGQSGIETSALGFGCASLGSRVSAGDGLRAMEAAHSAGVDWFDIAPVYGRGMAESIASRFIRAHRGEVQICTKVGLATPRNADGFMGTLMGGLVPLARRIITLVPGLRKVVKRTGLVSNRKLALTPELLRASIEGSLRRLGTDHVDLYALHDASAEEVTNDAVLRTLSDIVASGKARAVAVAVASNSHAVRVGIEQGTPYGVMQFAMPAPGAASEGETDLIEAARKRNMGTIVHSVMDVMGTGLPERLAADSRAWAACAEAAGTSDPRTVLARMLVARALARNSDGVVVLSMFSPENLRTNVAVATAAQARIDAALQELERVAAMAGGGQMPDGARG